MKPVDVLLGGKDLNRLQSRNLFLDLLKRQFEPESAKQLLVLLQKKGVHSDELTGLIEAVQSLEKPITSKARFLVDGCGTGGDGKHTFNISTIACLVAAASGAQVAKHGNRSVSSLCGSADLLESLGIKIDAPKNRMLSALQKEGFGYFHAPLYHPIFKRIANIRRDLAKRKIKTIFNLAGPFLNPLRPKRQLIGVWKKDLISIMAKTAQNLKLKHILIVWNTAGFDELTTGQPTMMAELRNLKLTFTLLHPKRFHLKRSKDGDLKGGSVAQNRRIALRILSAKDRSARFDVVLLNAGTILYVSGKTRNIEEGIRLARQAVYSGSAFKLIKRLVRISHDSK